MPNGSTVKGNLNQHTTRSHRMLRQEDKSCQSQVEERFLKPCRCSRGSTMTHALHEPQGPLDGPHRRQRGRGAEGQRRGQRRGHLHHHPGHERDPILRITERRFDAASLSVSTLATRRQGRTISAGVVIHDSTVENISSAYLGRALTRGSRGRALGFFLLALFLWSGNLMSKPQTLRSYESWG